MAQAVDPATGDATLVVVGLPAPQSGEAFGVETISADALSSTAAGTLESALANIPGFQQFRRSDSRSTNVSAQGITLRGIGGNATSRTLLLRDGIPVADAFFGFVPFTALPVEDVAQVRVTRGSGIGPFGAGALAGVIEVSSQPLAARDSTSFAVATGSNDAWQGDASLVHPLGAGHVAFDIHHDRGDGFFTTPPEQRVPASVPARYRASSAGLTAQVPIDPKTLLTARVGLFRDDRTLRFAGADSRGEGVDAAIRVTGIGRWQWEFAGWVQARDFTNIVVSATSFRPTLDQRATPSTGWGGKAELRPSLGGTALLRLGLDVRGATGVAAEDVLSGAGPRTATRRSGGDSFTGGAFAEGEVRMASLLFAGGVRIDHWRLADGLAQEFSANGAVVRDVRFVTRSGAIMSARGAMMWDAGDGLRLRAAAYTGFRLPTLNELYRGFSLFPVVTRANDALEPERLRGGEVGLTWAPVAGVTMTLTAFDNRLADAIANVTIAANVRERRNIAAIRARGLEAAVQATFGPWQLDAGWSYSHARVRAAPGDAAAMPLDGLAPAQSPAHAGGASLGWRFGPGALARLAVRHVGAQFEDDRNIDRLPGATMVEGLVRLPLGRGMTAELRAENIFDVDIVTRSSAGSIDLGTPRIIWLGLRWRRQ